MLRIKPGPAEDAAGAVMRTMLMSLLTTHTAPMLQPVSAQATPVVNVMNRSADGNSANYTAQPGFKAARCSTLAQHGFGTQFWWVN